MLTSTRGLATAIFTIFAAAPAFAQNEEAANAGGLTVSGNVALVTDYRFRGVSLSGGDPAIQGGADIAHDSGFYAGAWASSIDGGPALGEVELDLYGGWSGRVAEGVTLDAGLIYYAYPAEDVGADVDYLETYASVAGTLGPLQARVGAAYAWDQDSLGSQDNFYLYTDLSAGVPTTPLTVSGHLGYTDGALAPPSLAGKLDDSGFDWSAGATVTVLGGLELGVSYIGVEGPSIGGFTDDTLVGTLGFSF